jgi:plasmid stabilization system protein ParE
MVQVIWTPLAQDDVTKLFHYYEQYSNRFARWFVEEVFQRANMLEMMPEMGSLELLCAHLNRNYRYLLVYRRYKIIYLYEDGICYILMLWDCKNNPELLRNSERLQ